MSLTNYFARTYIVNLPHRADRRRDMRAMLARCNIHEKPGFVEFFPAVRPTSRLGFPSIGARGCFLSHLAILRRARQERLPNILILEDDLEIAPTLAGDSSRVLEMLETESWDMAYFGHEMPIVREQWKKDDRPLHRAPYGWLLRTTHFYAVNGPALPDLIGFLETVLGRPAGHPDGGLMHLDAAYATFRSQNPQVKTLIAWPSLGWQRSSASDVSSRWFDRVPGLHGLAKMARSVRAVAHR